jgi:3-phosphoshikimate 1-carboxyvinyltransferase
VTKAVTRRLSDVSSNQKPWRAPTADEPIRATVTLPGSKSETNRALILAALATGPSTITGGLEARDTQVMRDALRALGVRITEGGGQWRVEPPARFTGGATIDCGLAGTVMRFVPPVAALADGPVSFDGDEQAYGRPMDVILESLATLGVTIEADHLALPFTLTGDPELAGGTITVDASASSQFVSALLLAGARYAGGIDVRHDGKPIPSQPHIDMTVKMLRDRGVAVDDAEPNRWVVSPGPIAPQDVTIEPDLSNAAPFLAAAAITGGEVTVTNWPRFTHQPGHQLRSIFHLFGAEAVHQNGVFTVRGVDRLHGVDLDLHEASELTPVIAAMAALADSTTHIRGVAHIRGHETDRLAALDTELSALGVHVNETDDGLTIHPRLLHGGVWSTYADHRMAQAGALLGLVVPDIEIDDISVTSKTMPEFAQLWTQMIADSVTRSDRDAAPVADPPPSGPDNAVPGVETLL